jgi:hypothetical protein
LISITNSPDCIDSTGLANQIDDALNVETQSLSNRCDEVWIKQFGEVPARTPIDIYGTAAEGAELLR